MSIEQALSELTSAVKQLTTVMSSAGLATSAPAAPAPAAKPTKASAPAAAPANPPAAAPATPPAAAPAALDFDKDVVGALKKLSTARGRDGVMAVLNKYLPGDTAPAVPKLKPLAAKYAEIVADADHVSANGTLPGAAPAAEDDLGLG